METEVRLFAANKKQLTVLGALPVHIKVKSADGTSEISMRDLLYVVEELADSYLSRETLVGLGSIPEYFPMPPPRREYGEVSAIRGTASDMEEDKPCHQGVISKGEAAPCGCPIRVTAPDPTSMPHPATEEYRKQNEDFLRQYYGPSSFNVCKHQSLPMMHGPALEIHLKEGAVPHAIYTPAEVSVHWREKVKADMRDVELGVL